MLTPYPQAPPGARTHNFDHADSDVAASHTVASILQIASNSTQNSGLTNFVDMRSQAHSLRRTTHDVEFRLNDKRMECYATSITAAIVMLRR